MAVCVGKGCGQRSGKHGRLWKRRDGSRVGGFGEGDLFSEKAPFPYASYAFKTSLLWNVPLRYPSRSASSKEARFRLMAETRSGMSCTISAILPHMALLADYLHIAGAGDLFKAAGRIVQHAQIVGFGQTSDMGGGLADHLRVARLFALDGALQSFIQFRKQGTDGFVRCLALLLSILERPFLSVLCGKGRFLFRCFGNGWNGLLLRSRVAVSCGKDVREGVLLGFGEGDIFFGGRLDNRSHRYAELVLAVGREPCPQGARQAASSSNERGPGCGAGRASPNRSGMGASFSAGCAGVGLRTGSVRLMTSACGSSPSPANESSG